MNKLLDPINCLKVIFVVLCAAYICLFGLAVTGCGTLAPIHTKLSFELHDGRKLKYQSQKDLMVTVNRTDPETGELSQVISINSQASPAAEAQLERDKVQAQKVAELKGAIETIATKAAEVAF